MTPGTRIFDTFQDFDNLRSIVDLRLLGGGGWSGDFLFLGWDFLGFWVLGGDSPHGLLRLTHPTLDRYCPILWVTIGISK
jgi:hypothetical protein